MGNFFARYKRIILILGMIAFVVLVAYLMYLMFFKPSFGPGEAPSATPTSTPISGGGLPSAGSGQGGQVVAPGGEQLPEGEGTSAAGTSLVANGGLTKINELTTAAGLGPTIASDGGGLQYYDKGSGKFYRVDLSGQATTLTDKTFHSVERVTWAPDKNKAILEYPDGANIIYDFKNNQQITLPSHWKDFDFSPDGKNIVMKSMGIDPDNRWLAVVSEDGSSAKKIEALGDKDETVYPSWSPNNQIIAMYTEGVDFNRQEVYFVGLNGENFKSTVVEGRDFRYQWAPKGDRLLYSVYSSDNNMKPALWLVNAQGDSIGTGRHSLGVETWADKCVFANSYDLYCAVPEKLDNAAGLFPELAQNTPDKLYKIDTRTGLKNLVAAPDGDFNMKNLLITNGGSTLYFTDANSQKLYNIKLR